MGRALLIIVSGLMLSASIAQISLQDRQQTLFDRTNTFIRDAETRNMANSGLEIALKKLDTDNTWRDGISNLSLGGGLLNVLVEDATTNSSLEANQIKVTSTGTIQDTSSEVTGILAYQGGLPETPSPLGIYSNNLNLNMSGNSVLINGNDKNTNGTSGPKKALPGLTVGGPDAYNNVHNNLTSDQLNNITGAGSTPSVEQADIEGADLQPFIDKYTADPDIVVSSDLNSAEIGTPDNPQITVINGDIHISGVTGAGILVVESGNSISITGNFDFKGLIILQGNTNFEADIYGNTHINGALLCSSSDPSANFDIDLRGNVTMNYGSQSLVALEKKLSDKVDSQLQQVTRYE